MLVDGLARKMPDIEPLAKKQSDWWHSVPSQPGQKVGLVERQTIYNLAEGLVRNDHRTDMRTEMYGFVYGNRDMLSIT